MERPKRGVSNSDKVAEMPRFPGVTCGLVITLCIIICIACLAYLSNAFIPPSPFPWPDSVQTAHHNTPPVN